MSDIESNRQALYCAGIDPDELIEGSACAALWANCYGNAEDESMDRVDLDTPTCQGLSFQIDGNELWTQKARDLVSEVIAWAADNLTDVRVFMYQTNRDAENVGHDFALSRAGHGTGLWDRGADDALSDRLHKAATVYGSGDLFATLDSDGDVTRIDTF